MFTEQDRHQAKKLAEQIRQRAAAGELIDYCRLIADNKTTNPAFATELQKLHRIEAAKLAAKRSSTQGDTHGDDRFSTVAVDVPDYELIRPIGSGGFGIVFLAKNRHDGHFTAVKILHEGREADLNGIRQYKLRATDNEFLVPVGHVGKVDSQYYYLMPLADDANQSDSFASAESYESMTLDRYLNRVKKLPMSEVSDIADRLLQGLAQLHAAGGIHRDVKPANIMRLNRQWCLGDPGLMSGEFDRSTLAGSPGYLPNDGTNDCTLDLFGAGKTLFTIATGYGIQRFAELRDGTLKVERNDPQMARLLAATLRACSPNTNERFRSADEMRTAILADEPPLVAARSTRRRVATWAIAGAIMWAAFGSLGPFRPQSDVPKNVANNVANNEANNANAVALRAEPSGVDVPIGSRDSTAGDNAHAAARNSDQAAVTIDSTVNHFRFSSGDYASAVVLGRTSDVTEGSSYVAHVNDMVFVDATFTSPVYAYVIAFNPDGSTTLLSDARWQSTQRSAQLKAPSGVNGYELSDGPGSQAIVIAASTHPLPSFDKWHASAEPITWKPTIVEKSEVWVANNGSFAPPFAGVVRGLIKPLLEPPNEFTELSRYFEQQADFSVVQLIGFQVRQRDPEDVTTENPATADSATYDSDLDPWQRTVPEAVSTAVDAIGARIDSIYDQYQFAEVADLFAQKAQHLRVHYGPDHWKTVQASAESSLWRRAAALDTAQQKRFLDTIQQHYDSMEYDAQGDLIKAGELGAQALSGFNELIGNDAMYSLVAAYFQGGFTLAVGNEEQAVADLRVAWNGLCSELGPGHPKTVAGCLQLLAALRLTSRFAETEEVVQATHESAARQAGPTDGQVVTLINNLADALVRLGRADEAEQRLNETLELYANDQDIPLERATLRVRLAQALRSQGRLVEAEKEMLAVVDYYSDNLDPKRYELQILNKQYELAKIWSELGRYEDANLLLTRIRSPREAYYDAASQSIYNFLDDQVKTLVALGRHLDAFELLREKHQQLVDHYPPDEPILLALVGRMGDCLTRMARLEEAEQLLLPVVQSERNFSRPDAFLDFYFANLRRAQGQLDEAEFHYDRAKKSRYASGVNGPAFTLQADEQLARIQFMRGNLQQAADAYTQLLANTQGESRDQNTTQALLSGLARCQFAQGKYALAAKTWGESSRLFNQLRSRNPGFEGSYLEDSRSPARELAATFAHLGEYRKAWKALDEGVSRGLRDELQLRSESLSGERVSVARERIEIERGIRLLQSHDDRLATERADELDAKLNDIRLREERIRRQQISFERTTRSLSLPEVQQQLDETMALVYWLDVDCFPAERKQRESWACVVRSQGEPAWIELPEGLVSDGFVGNGSLDDATARAVREQRLDPIRTLLAARDDLPLVEHLIVVPFGNVLDLPMEIPLSTDPQLESQLTISYAPSASVFALLRQSRRTEAKAHELFLVSAGTTDLPGTQLSVDGLAARFAADQKTVLVGQQATVEKINEVATAEAMRAVDFVHIALHGEANETAFLGSFLRLPCESTVDPLEQLLAGVEWVNDGRIYANQVRAAWRLDAELVTIAACDSNRGVRTLTEGDIGFSQALLLAGARRAIVSQWAVDDRATALLMNRFYDNLFDRKLKPSCALSEAKRYLRDLSADDVHKTFARLPVDDGGQPSMVRGRIMPLPTDTTGSRPFRDPYYWAGFVLIGDI